MKNNYISILLFVLVSQLYFAQDVKGRFDFEGVSRYYEVYIPQNFQVNLPLVFALHGYGESIEQFKDFTRLHQFADTAGFILVYPGGIDKSWNIGLKYCPTRGNLPTVNDVGFISALIDTLNNQYTVDMERIYCCGYSTGGEMTYRLACELGQRFAAISSVGGGMYDSAENWNPIRPMSVLQIHGTKDQYSFYYHPDSTFNPHSAETWSIVKVLDYWKEKNQCSLLGDTVAIPDLVPSDLCNVQKITFSEDTYNTEIVHYKIINGGHTWPGSPAKFPYWTHEGNRNMDINANEVIWEFFQQFKNPLVNVARGNSIKINQKYIQPVSDTLLVGTKLTNLENHSIAVYAMINGNNQSFSDTIELFDDGLHSDGDASDNIFGETLYFSNLAEDNYTVRLLINDRSEEISISTPYVEHFTTRGPIKIDSLEITSPEPTAIPGKNLNFNITLKNYGSTDTVRVSYVNINLPESQFIKNKTNPIWRPLFGEIAPGESISSSRSFVLSFQDSCPSGIYEFGIEIISDDKVYWHDIFLIEVESLTDVEESKTFPHKFSLDQNYPNPFNPSTTIKYSIPRSSVIPNSVRDLSAQIPDQARNDNVILKVYDILGREAAILVNEKQKPGNYEITWDAKNNPSGVYFCQLKTGDYVETKKMILLK